MRYTDFSSLRQGSRFQVSLAGSVCFGGFSCGGAFLFAIVLTQYLPENRVHVSLSVGFPDSVCFLNNRSVGCIGWHVDAMMHFTLLLLLNLTTEQRNANDILPAWSGAKTALLQPPGAREPETAVGLAGSGLSVTFSGGQGSIFYSVNIGTYSSYRPPMRAVLQLLRSTFLCSVPVDGCYPPRAFGMGGSISTSFFNDCWKTSRSDTDHFGEAYHPALASQS